MNQTRKSCCQPAQMLWLIAKIQSHRRTNTRLFVSNQSLRHWADDMATLIVLKWTALPSLGVDLWSTEPRHHQGWKRPPRSSGSNEHSTAKFSTKLRPQMPPLHPCTAHKTSLVLHSSRDQLRHQNLRGTSIFPGKTISLLLLSAFWHHLERENAALPGSPVPSSSQRANWLPHCV